MAAEASLLSGMPEMVPIIVSLAVTTAAALWDWRHGRIPNVFTFPAILLGIVYSFSCFSIQVGLARCILIVLLFAAGTLRILGMGDLKLLMAIGALTGSLCLAVTAFLASLLVLMSGFIRHRKETWSDFRAGLTSLLTLDFDARLGTGRKVKFAPYILWGLIGGVIVCFRF